MGYIFGVRGEIESLRVKLEEKFWVFRDVFLVFLRCWLMLFLMFFLGISVYDLFVIVYELLNYVRSFERIKFFLVD